MIAHAKLNGLDREAPTSPTPQIAWRRLCQLAAERSLSVELAHLSAPQITPLNLNSPIVREDS
jgi:hypothetical protein